MIEKSVRLGRYKNGEKVLIIKFPYNRTDLKRVKLIPGRQYHPNKKVWSCRYTKANLNILKGFGWEIDPELYAKLKDGYTSMKDIKPVKDIKGLKLELYPYQKKGVAFLEAKNGSALIADEMGLGKTAQALAYTQLHPEFEKVLIIVPASLKLNWRKEARLWMDKPKVQILSGKTPYEIDSRIVIINYDILDSWIDVLISWKPELVIADEVHYIKNNKALRTKATKKLAKVVPRFIGLSGTPIVNRPIEFFNALKIIDPKLFPSYWEYVQNYCGMKHNGFGWDLTGATNTKQLHEILTNTVMIRRLKKEVLTELPDKIKNFFPLELSPTERREYEKAEHHFIEWLAETRGLDAAHKAKNAETLVQIEALKQVTAKAKLSSAITWIKDFLESNDKLVLFATHKFIISALMKEFGDIAVKLDGSTNNEDRQKAVDFFQDDPGIRLFIANIKAGGVGITLTASSNVAFLELPWTPGELVQAEDRCHRIGQKDVVNVFYLLAEETIDEKIANLLDEKRKVLDSVLDGVQTDEKSLLMELIENY